MLNVMDEYILFTKKCFHKYLKLIMDKSYTQEIAEEFVDTYITVRYSNYLEETTKKFSLLEKVNKAIEDLEKRMIKASPDSKEVIELTSLFVAYFFYLDQLYILETQKKTISDIEKAREKLLGIKDNFNTEFQTMLREDTKKRKDFLASFDSDVFHLELSPISSKNSNDIEVKLVNNIKFPDLYSDVAIKKVEERDVISENLTAITFLQVSSLLVNEIMTFEFDKKYYVRLSESLFDKKTKIARVFHILDNPFIQDRVRIIIDYHSFVRYKSYVMEYMRNGFVFVLNLDDTFDYSSENIEYLELFDKILLKSSKYYYKDMKNNGKIKNRIISVDEVK